MKHAARAKAPASKAPAAPSRLPDTFSLHFRRTPDGWRVDGAGTGFGRYAFEAFDSAFCNIPTSVPVPRPQSTAPVLALTHFIGTVPPTAGCPACTALERSCTEHAFSAALAELHRLRKRVARKGGAR